VKFVLTLRAPLKSYFIRLLKNYSSVILNEVKDLKYLERLDSSLRSE